MIRLENLPEDALARFEKLFFEAMCNIATGNRKALSTPLPQCEGLHFACVQDTVERLTELESGRLSALQWRNFVFAPIDRSINPRDVYLKVFDDLRRSVPSIFIRSYVYVVFIAVYGSSSMHLEGLGVGSNEPRIEDYHTYQWNTKHDIVRVPPSKLSEIGRPGTNRSNEAASSTTRTDGIGGGKAAKHVEKVFLVSDPRAELQRIQDANSDVIDAVKAFTGNLGLAKQTEDKLHQTQAALKEPGARVILRGPARSGKTIIAMSLLGSDRSAKMLLMNWYFYEALKDAFKVWARQDEEEIAKLFSPSKEVMGATDLYDAELQVLRAHKQDERILPALLEMWNPDFVNRSFCRWENRDGEWLLGGCQGKVKGDIVYVHKKTKNAVSIRMVGQTLDNGLARPVRILPSCSLDERPLGGLEQNVPDLPLKWNDVPHRLLELQEIVESQGVSKVIAARIKCIAEALESSDQRFFHHDRRPAREEGFWIRKGRKLIPDSCTLVCDEAQRLGDYADLDETEWVRHRSGSTLLCGDDNQRLNRRGDTGIESTITDSGFQELSLPDSIGIPKEIELLVLALLGERDAPIAPGSFTVKLLHDDDLGLVSAFEEDTSKKKHYAIPMSSGFYPNGYVPCITKSKEPTAECTEDCEGNYCLHRYIRSLCPILDPEYLPKRKDLSESYKFFCAEAIMSNYALSAYELISREVESLYLKIPRRIGIELLQVSIKGDEIISWIKRHLYVLMTRATANLIINVEDEGLYESFKKTCKQARMMVE